MKQPALLAHLSAAVRDSHLLRPEQLRELPALVRLCHAARDLGRLLRKQSWLTSFQVNEIYGGRGEALLFGPYLFLERLGQGGMGKVFKAQHRLMRLLAAVKPLHPGVLARLGGTDRFLREVEATARRSGRVGEGRAEAYGQTS